MINKLRQQIDNIQYALDWIKENEPQDYERQFLNFVEERRKLRKIMASEVLNPAASAYGESQKGKSYLMSNLLQKDGVPFSIKYGEQSYNFIEEINPIGNKTEATGVVTRFTSFKRGGELYSEEYPLVMRALSVCDIILILADGYYNDIRNFCVADNIKARVDEFYKQYSTREPVIGQLPLQADDLLEMQFYFTKYINNAQAYGKEGFFKRLALVVDRIPVSDYEKVFGLLWDNNEHFSQMFNRLLAMLTRINYAEFVYLHVDAVLHKNNNENTIMAVQCLHGVSPESQATTTVFLRRNERFVAIDNVRKCDLSAICAEVIVKIPDDYVECTAEYSFEGITDQTVLSQMTKTPVRKDIIKNIDLLDFPGARSRLQQELEKLGEGSTLTSILLRGKVAYLFNKYNENRSINVLLFCHDQEKSEVKTIPTLLNEWVNNYVGTTPEERAEMVRSCGGIGPLFYLSTKFNIDMAVQPISTYNSEEAINGRWHQRFYKVLYSECFEADTKEWVKNWTRPGEIFANSYLLRDYKFSGDNYSRLYRGFESTGRETEKYLDDEYYNTMRSTFISNPETKKFFQNPELAWDVAATINNDGALYIIEKLAVVAERMYEARTRQFETILNKAQKVVLDAMTYYRPANDNNEQMQKNINNAFAVLRELDFACNRDNYFFGHLIEGLQIAEKDIYDQLHRLVLGGSLNEPINDFEQYQIIREHCRNFEGCKTLDDKWNRLMKCYHYPSKEYCINDMHRRKVDTNILFADKLMPQLPSYIIADKMLELWQQKITSVDFLNIYSSEEGFAPMVLTELVNNIVDAVQRFNILEVLHNDIKSYTDISAVQNIPVSLVSDIIASTISNFVSDLGFSMMEEEQKNELRALAEKEYWPIFKYISIPRQELFTEDEVAAIFNQVLSSGTALTPAFKYNFFSWEEFVFISFAMRVERPKYDLEVSQRLAEIINNIQSV